MVKGIIEKWYKRLEFDKKYDKDFYKQFDLCVCIAITDSFFEGNPATKELLFKLYVDILNNRFNKKTSKEDNVAPFDIPNSGALHALRFEKYGKEQGEYASITDEECREQVFNQPAYVQVLDNHPFEKEEYVQRFIKRFKIAYCFATKFSSFVEEDSSYSLFPRHTALSWSYKMSSYFEDALAHHVWKEVGKEYVDRTNDAGENISESQNPVDISTMLNDYLKNLN